MSYIMQGSMSVESGAVVPELQFVEFPDLPPSGEYWFGTNSRGQDLFWQLTFAFRNTLGFGIMVAPAARSGSRSMHRPPFEFMRHAQPSSPSPWAMVALHNGGPSLAEVRGYAARRLPDSPTLGDGRRMGPDGPPPTGINSRASIVEMGPAFRRCWSRRSYPYARLLKESVRRWTTRGAGACRPRIEACPGCGGVLVRDQLARPGPVLATHLRVPEHAGVRDHGGRVQPRHLHHRGPGIRVRGRSGRPGPDGGQRRVRHAPAATGPAGVLFRAGEQPQYHQPGAAYGLPRLAVRRAPDPLHRARAAPPRVHPPRDLLRDEPAEDHVRGAPPARSTRTRSARRS